MLEKALTLPACLRHLPAIPGEEKARRWRGIALDLSTAAAVKSRRKNWPILLFSGLQKTRMSQVFLSAEYRYRTLESLIAVAMSGAIGVGLLWFVPHMSGWVKALPIALSTAFVLLAIAGLWWMVRNRVDCVRIDDEGIRHGSRYWPWEQVRWLYAIGDKSSPAIDLQLQAVGEFTVVGLPLTPKLSAEQYEDLIRRIRRTIGGAHPRLQLGGYDFDVSV